MTAAIALVPVLLLLSLLQLLDSFKLVRISTVLLAIGAGALLAIGCLAVHTWLLDVSGLNVRTFARYVAPVTEESIKAAAIVFLLWRGRVGFLVDAAVLGFAIGTGFALVENIDYLRRLTDPSIALWFVRGLGTAVLHGATTAIVAMLAKTLMDRSSRHVGLAVLPGVAFAIVVHSAFNHVLLSPLAMTFLILLVLPILIVVVFQRSEAATREWVGAGLDLDLEVLELVRSELFAETRFGTYLRELRRRFHGLVVADMFCLLRLELELSIQAKAMLMAREAGLVVPVTEDLHLSLREIDYLQTSIGSTGLLAIKPLQVVSDRDRWHRFLLAEAARSESLIPNP